MFRFSLKFFCKLWSRWVFAVSQAFLLLPRAGAPPPDSAGVSSRGSLRGAQAGGSAQGPVGGGPPALALLQFVVVVVAGGLRCSTECAIAPDQGSNPYPLHWQADSYSLGHQGSPEIVLKQ